MSAPVDALAAAAANLRSAEDKHAASKSALDTRRARLREAETAAAAFSAKIAAADPSSKDFRQLSADRTMARDAAEALRSQLAIAEAEHAQLGKRVDVARRLHGDAIRVEVEARIGQSSAEIDGTLAKFLRLFSERLAAHMKLLEEGGSQLAPTLDPANPAFWTRLRGLYVSSLKLGSPERVRADGWAAQEAQVLASMLNQASMGRGSGAPG